MYRSNTNHHGLPMPDVLCEITNDYLMPQLSDVLELKRFIHMRIKVYGDIVLPGESYSVKDIAAFLNMFRDGEIISHLDAPILLRSAAVDIMRPQRYQ